MKGEREGVGERERVLTMYDPMELALVPRSIERLFLRPLLSSTAIVFEGMCGEVEVRLDEKCGKGGLDPTVGST